MVQKNPEWAITCKDDATDHTTIITALMNIKSKITNGIIMTQEGKEPVETQQMLMKKGLKVFEKDGETAVRDEMQQLNDWKVMLPVKNKELTYEQRKEALGYLMFLKHKRSGKIKGRGCTDGRKECGHIAKEDTA